MSAEARHAAIRFLAPLLAMALLAQFRAAAQQDPPDLQTVMWNQEHDLAKAEQQQDRQFFQKALDDKLIYVAFNGLVFTKPKLVDGLNYIDVSHYEIEDMKTRALGANAALVSYDLKIKGNIGPLGLPEKQYASSVWVKNGERWQLIFHQSTPARHH
jgi:hypothetical protein